MSSVNLITCVILVALLLVVDSFGNSLTTGIQNGTTTNEHNICSRNAACKFAICLRRNNNSSSCTFVPLLYNSHCVCPPRQICTINTDMTKIMFPFIYPYHCRNPWTAFGIPKI